MITWRQYVQNELNIWGQILGIWHSGLTTTKRGVIGRKQKGACRPFFCGVLNPKANHIHGSYAPFHREAMDRRPDALVLNPLSHLSMLQPFMQGQEGGIYPSALVLLHWGIPKDAKIPERTVIFTSLCRLHHKGLKQAEIVFQGLCDVKYETQHIFRFKRHETWVLFMDCGNVPRYASYQLWVLSHGKQRHT